MNNIILSVLYEDINLPMNSLIIVSKIMVAGGAEAPPLRVGITPDR